jgi:4a-hydroxytetrahydrobiopterin dehydratase
MNWITKDNKLEKEFIFNDFVEAFAFLTKVAIEAEKQNHHPEIYNVYNKVKISLQTHDAGNIVTEKDYKLAQTIDSFFMIEYQIKINLEKIIKRKTKSYPHVELDEEYIGQFLLQNGFLLIRYNSKLYYFRNNVKIRDTDIDNFLVELVRNSEDKVIKLNYSLTKKNVLEALYIKRVIAKKQIVKHDLMNSLYNKDDDTSLSFLKSCNVL